VNEKIQKTMGQNLVTEKGLLGFAALYSRRERCGWWPRNRVNRSVN